MRGTKFRGFRNSSYLLVKCDECPTERRAERSGGTQTDKMLLQCVRTQIDIDTGEAHNQGKFDDDDLNILLNTKA